MGHRHTNPEAANPLREARVRVGLSQAQLAEKAGLSLGWLNNIERAPGLISPRVAQRLALVLGVPADALLASSVTRRGLRVW